MLILFEQMAHTAYGKDSAKILFQHDVIATLLPGVGESEGEGEGEEVVVVVGLGRYRDRRELELERLDNLRERLKVWVQNE